MKKLNVGIIGAGRIGQVHAKSITYHIPQAKIVAISDIYYEGAEKVAESLGIPNAYEDYHEILNNPEIDAVLICSSTDTHADIAVEAAEAGKHIFCEKPVDLTVAKIKKVIAAVEKAGVKLQIGFNRRYDHNFAEIKRLANDGKLGKLQTIKITSRDPEPPSIDYVKVSGGIFLDMTVHDFDMARFIGGEVEEVYANAAVTVDEAIGEAGDVDTALIALKFKNGAIGVIDNCRKACYGYDQRLEVFGTGGQASAANDTPTNVSYINENGNMTDKPLYFFLERYMQSFTDEMTEFINAVQNDELTKTTVNDGLEALRLGLAAKLSVKEHRPVKLSEIEA
ncbi:inositol 2-dehydrogenase [Eubacterium sp.]|uniref:inositol 2-dehydrogenase n=1 Tax=Eubacterium sp. TaxID=142586 RepID=UPI0025D30463|nr:inositol 2-dehydrogenase [Eubacterium sp.]MDY3812585.1 inositol 2-dehydrogenase [Eubacterium sp.]MDY5243357.1 inositol 2-dehydrogenase [Eubacterium sp.]